MLDEITEDLRDYFYDKGDTDLQVELDDEIINVYLDLPDTRNYDSHIDAIERFFRRSKYDVEDFEISGDYEGHIEILYI